VSSAGHKDRSPSGAAPRRSWPFLALIAAFVGLSAPTLPAAHDTGRTAGTETPFVDHDGARKAAIKHQSAQPKQQDQSARATSEPPPATAIVPRSGALSFGFADRLPHIRPHDDPAPAYRVAAQPRAPPASRA
jgi:hypothetical protein